MLRLLPVLLAAALSGAPLAASAETIGGNPGPAHNYVCPHADGQAPLDCYFDAVQHLYTMCRNIKSIEILEFGYEDSLEGPNNAKYESCLDKQKLNMKAPYQAALREARVSKQAGEGVKSLQEFWLAAMQRISWARGESDDDYKARVARVYDDFTDKIEGIRTIVAVVREHTSPIGTAHAKAPAERAAQKAASRPARAPAAAKTPVPPADKAPPS